MKHPKASLGYVAELDGIRAAAIGAVMLLHGRAPYSQGGFIGVDIFFVMSGFLIPSLLLQEYERSGGINLKNFYMRRLLRLTPALVLFLGVVVAAGFLLFDQEQIQQDITSAVVSVTYIANWVRAFNWHDMDHLGHTWSLAIEEQFYLLWPLILTVMLRWGLSVRAMILVTSLLALLSFAWRFYLMWHDSGIARVYFAFDTRADGLLVGCILGMLFFYRNPALRNRLLSWLLVAISLLAVAGLLLFHVLADAYEPYMYYWGMVVVNLLAAGLILGVVGERAGPLNALLRLKPLVWLGGISYGIYLWHLPIFWGLRGLGYSYHYVLAIGVPASIAIAALSFYLWERPFLGLKHRFGPGTTPPARPAVAPLPAGSTERRVSQEQGTA